MKFREKLINISLCHRRYFIIYIKIFNGMYTALVDNKEVKGMKLIC